MKLVTTKPATMHMSKGSKNISNDMWRWLYVRRNSAAQEAGRRAGPGNLLGLASLAAAAAEAAGREAARAAHTRELRDRLEALPRLERLRAVECLLKPAYYFVTARRGGDAA